MNLNSAKALALRLMRKHRLIERGWQFHWNSNARRAGVCRVRRARLPAHVRLASGLSANLIQIGADQKQIELSRYWTRIHSRDLVEETILHEIAHALAGPEAHHGPAWKKIASCIGAKPQSCFVVARLAKKANYTVFCENCGHPQYLYKLSSIWRKRSCKFCGSSPIIFDHRRKVHFCFIFYSSLASRRMLTKKEFLSRLGRRLRLSKTTQPVNGS
jgi:hypothetical protein